MQSREYIGMMLQVEIDRPMGSRHPQHGFLYPLNYGFLPGTQAADGEEIDAYLLGVFEPVGRFVGRCIAVIQRRDEDDDKLILAPDGRDFSDDQIAALTEFQERFFESVILRR